MRGDFVPQVASRLFSAHLDSLYELLSFVKHSAKEAGVEENELLRLELATDEVFVNIVEHGYQGSPGEVFIACEAHGSEFRIIFKDRGRSYNPLAEANSFQPKNAHTSRPHGGFGIYFVLKIMDRLEYKRVDDQNIFTIVKRKPSV